MKSLVLVGLPEMQHRMTLARNRPLWSRIHTRVHLGDARVEDTGEHFEHRLTRAGGNPGVLSSDAIAMLHVA